MAEFCAIPKLGALEHALSEFPQIVMPLLEDASTKGLLVLVATLATYPPAGRGTYQRTGTLGRLWTTAQPAFTSIGSGFTATLGNATAYGPFVQGATTQARAFQGRWTTDQDAVDQRTVEIQAFFSQALADAAQALEQGL